MAKEHTSKSIFNLTNATRTKIFSSNIRRIISISRIDFVERQS